MTRSSTARIFLKLNSQYSALNGIVLLGAAAPLANIIFVQPADWASLGLRLLGAGLLGFAALLIFLAKNKFVTKTAVNKIVLLDAIWVVGSVLILVFQGHILTSTGAAIVAVVATLVAVLAVGQFVGAKKITKPLSVAEVRLENSNLIATVRRTVNAPTQVIWDVMTDHPAYADVASNIAKIEVLSGDGLGMKRRCFGPKGESWVETCDFFEPGRAFGFRIHTEAEDYPYPNSELSGKWSTKPLETGSEFGIEIVAKPKGNALTRLMFTTLAKQQFKTVLIDLADAWATRMEQKARS